MIDGEQPAQLSDDFLPLRQGRRIAHLMPRQQVIRLGPQGVRMIWPQRPGSPLGHVLLQLSGGRQLALLGEHVRQHHHRGQRVRVIRAKSAT